MLDTETTRFVDAATALPAAALEAAYERQLDLLGEGGNEASDAAGPSASANAELDHRIRAALLPRADELDEHRIGLHSDARTAISTAARAIVTRRRLTAEQFTVLVTPFVELGFDIPAHTG
ncbi:hypothetical protein [Agromyces cerinus]|uniref:Uncharacterized protein n=1 Tax=Agromyces cerinus subsp. cerinus TaxID=232089 RepID=A0A1N6FD82_9MICO|nr:hypothetical protein [Agromyces cerinus]SIN93209.1 hypothetical protein SAMN05443544_1948 [Agromyces cerinus subsp. cerinus]